MHSRQPLGIRCQSGCIDVSSSSQPRCSRGSHRCCSSGQTSCASWCHLQRSVASNARHTSSRSYGRPRMPLCAPRRRRSLHTVSSCMRALAMWPLLSPGCRRAWCTCRTPSSSSPFRCFRRSCRLLTDRGRVYSMHVLPRAARRALCWPTSRTRRLWRSSGIRKRQRPCERRCWVLYRHHHQRPAHELRARPSVAPGRAAVVAGNGDARHRRTARSQRSPLLMPRRSWLRQGEIASR